MKILGEWRYSSMFELFAVRIWTCVRQDAFTENKCVQSFLKIGEFVLKTYWRYRGDSMNLSEQDNYAKCLVTKTGTHSWDVELIILLRIRHREEDFIHSSKISFQYPSKWRSRTINCTHTLESTWRRKEIIKTTVRTETGEQSEGIEVRNRI
jgi:hypothetical protein